MTIDHACFAACRKQLGVIYCTRSAHREKYSGILNGILTAQALNN